MNKLTVLEYSFAKIKIVLYFCAVQTSEQTLFNFLILGKSRFPRKKGLHQPLVTPSHIQCYCQIAKSEAP